MYYIRVHTFARKWDVVEIKEKEIEAEDQGRGNQNGCEKVQQTDKVLTFFLL